MSRPQSQLQCTHLLIHEGKTDCSVTLSEEVLGFDESSISVVGKAKVMSCVWPHR